MTETELGEGWIDEVADRFEEAWRNGSRPRIEDFIVADLNNGASALLEELVCVDVHHRRLAGELPLLAEYAARFPHHLSAVEAGFPAADAPGPPRDTDLFPDSVGAQVLLGLLALQHSFVDRVTLVSAFSDWVRDKSRGVGEILVDRGELTAVDLALLETLSAQTLKHYDGDVSKSLASRGTVDMIRNDLAQLHDAALDATLTAISGDSRTVFDSRIHPRNGKQSSSQGFPDARFRLIKRINSGGQGDVYLAMDEALNRKVALKRIRRRYAYSAEFQARLLVEAEVAARLEHPAFLPVHSVGFDAKGLPYFVMQYIEGNSSFSSKIKEFHAERNAARLPDERAQGLRKLLRHFVDVCYAVAYAHDRGVIHRDIKPANVLVGQFGETYLVDWGMVKFVEPVTNNDLRPHERLRPSPSHGSIFTVEGGTLVYMSPEQLARGPVSFGTDVYSLGVMLYVLLTGKLAFPGNDKTEIEANIQNGRFEHPRAVESRVPAALEAVCLKAMMIDSDQRYVTAKAMASDLEDWLADRPIMVYPEPMTLSARRWARNHKPAVAALAVLLVTSILYLVVAGVNLRQERTKTEENYVLARTALFQLVRPTGVPPKLKEVRDHIASTALEATSKFLKSRPNDPLVRLDAARTYRAIANMDRMVGELDVPLDLYQKALALLDQLPAKLRRDAEFVEERGMNLIDTAVLWQMNGKPAKSKVLSESALIELAALGRSLNNTQKLAKALALLSLATAQNEMDKYQEARDSGRRAIELLNSLGDNVLPQHEEAQVLAHTQVGLAELLLHNTAGAEKSFTQAVNLGVSLIDGGHNTPEVKESLACALIQRAEKVGSEILRREESLSDFRDGQLLLRALVHDYPHIPHYHRDLAVSYIARVDLFLAEGALGVWTIQFNEDAKTELGLYAGSRELFDYHRHLGRIYWQRAQIARKQGNRMEAKSWLAQATREHEHVLREKSPCQIDQRLLRRAEEERAQLR